MRRLKFWLPWLLLFALIFIGAYRAHYFPDFMCKGPYVDARAYASINAAVASSETAGKTVRISSNMSLTEPLTVPSDRHLEFLKGGMITLGDYNLTINGPISAPIAQIFDDSGAGSVGFGAGSVKEVYPEWWGNNTTPGTTDMTSEIKSGLAATNTADIPVQLLATDYLSSGKLSVPSGGALLKSGKGASNIFIAAGTDDDGIEATGYNVRLENFLIAYKDTSASGSAIYLNATTGCKIWAVRVYEESGFYTTPEYALKIVGGSNNRIYYGFFNGGVYINNTAGTRMFGTIFEATGKMVCELLGTSVLNEFHGCHFEGVDLSGTQYVWYDHSTNGRNLIYGGQITKSGTTAPNALAYIDVNRDTIQGCEIGHSSGNQAATAIQINSTRGFARILGNFVVGAIDESGSTNKNIIAGNHIFDANQKYFTRKGYNTIFRDNICFSNLDATPENETVEKSIATVSTSGTGEDDLASSTIFANNLGVKYGFRIKAAGTKNQRIK